MKIETDISQIRFKYKKNPFDIKNSDSNPFQQFKKWMTEAVTNKVFECTAMCLSTVNKKNKVSNRIVLLKGIENNSFVFFTNLNSRKSYELNSNKNVAAEFWWPQIGKQVRIEGYVKKVSKKKADKYFSTRSRKSQIGAWASNQSSVLKNRDELINSIENYKKKYSESKKVPRPNYWSGWKLKPDAIEFWLEGKNRIHDRLKYIKKENEWKKILLSP